MQAPAALPQSRAINYTARWRSAECPSDTMQAPPALPQSRAINYTARWRSAECPSDTMQAPPALSRPQDAHSFAGCFQHPASDMIRASSALASAGRPFLCRVFSTPGIGHDTSASGALASAGRLFICRVFSTPGIGHDASAPGAETPPPTLGV